VISISIDDMQSRSEIESFLRQAKPSFTVIHDPKGAAQRAFGVEPIPMNVALDAGGKIIATAGGDPAELDRAVAALAKSARAARASGSAARPASAH
jgi:hypothetical protein